MRRNSQRNISKNSSFVSGVLFDEFESIGIVNAKDKVARFYSVMFFYYSIYDGASA